MSVGVIGGVPLSTTRSTGLTAGRFGSGDWSVYTHPYTVGGGVEVRLPSHLSVEADALYNHTDTIEHAFMNPAFGSITRRGLNAWEFPMFITRSWSRRKLQPFAGAGGSFRRIDGYELSVEQFAAGFNPAYTFGTYPIAETLTQGGYAARAGVVAFKARRIRIAPEIRYTRSRSSRFLPSQNQVEFVVAVKVF